MSKKVAVIMGSDSDFPVVKGCIKTLKSFGIETEVRVLSAHRTPAEAAAFADSARERGYGVLIAAAAHTTLPVIGIPVKSSTLDGLDALLSTVQMPKGIPVATVAIDGADNAAYLAVQMLAIEDAALAQKLSDYKQEMERQILEKNAKLQEEVNAL